MLFKARTCKMLLFLLNLEKKPPTKRCLRLNRRAEFGQEFAKSGVLLESGTRTRWGVGRGLSGRTWAGCGPGLGFAALSHNSSERQNAFTSLCKCIGILEQIWNCVLNAVTLTAPCSLATAPTDCHEAELSPSL